MDEVYNILCDKNGINQYAKVELIENDEDVSLIFMHDEFCTKINAENYFDALISLRKELEKRSIKLLCKGCARNVYPSAMILSMGTGEKAYTLTMGKQARMSDLVGIFEPCNIQEYASIIEQETFFKEWLNSLKI